MPRGQPEDSGRISDCFDVNRAFWEVEHDALYKLEPSLKRIVGDKEMNARTSEVYQALTAFEDGFERLIPRKESR
jgi:hypothetical protein